MKKNTFLLIMSLFLFSACRESLEEEYPSITNSSFRFIINEDYDIIQSSATTCNFVKDEKISDMKILVEKIDKLNWDDRYVILEDTDKVFYLYDKNTEKMKKTKNYDSFLKWKKEWQVNLELKDKNAFEKQEP